MGKWATYRRRGSLGHLPEGPLPTPPPTLIYTEAEGFCSISNAPGNTGGNFELYQSIDGVGGWEAGGSAYASPFYQWTTWGDVSPGYYRCTETSVVPQWLGESVPSNVIHVSA